MLCHLSYWHILNCRYILCTLHVTESNRLIDSNYQLINIHHVDVCRLELRIGIMFYGRRAGIRTPIDRFGDGEPTVDRLSCMAGVSGFEPLNAGVWS